MKKLNICIIAALISYSMLLTGCEVFARLVPTEPKYDNPAQAEYYRSENEKAKYLASEKGVQEARETAKRQTAAWDAIVAESKAKDLAEKKEAQDHEAERVAKAAAEKAAQEASEVAASLAQADRERAVAFYEKTFAVPLLAYLEQGVDPFEAYNRTIKSEATNAVNFPYGLKQINVVNQRAEMAAFCNDLPSLCTYATASKIKGKIIPYYRAIEKQIFMKRTGGRSFVGRGLDGFTESNLGLTPSLDTVYPYGVSDSFYLLKVMQSVKGGVLIRGEDIANSSFPDKNLFIKTKRQYADGDELRPGFFVYIGLSEYKTVLGVAAKVHSFEEIDNPKENLFFY